MLPSEPHDFTLKIGNLFYLSIRRSWVVALLIAALVFCAGCAAYFAPHIRDWLAA